MSERKDLDQEFIPLEASGLLAAVADIKSEGYRLGQACATKTDEGIEVLYCFEKDNGVKSMKVTIDDKAPELQSVTGIYGYAFIYENEIHDLFGVTFRNLNLDYGGKFFKVAGSAPWNPNLGVKKEGGEE